MSLQGHPSTLIPAIEYLIETVENTKKSKSLLVIKQQPRNSNPIESEEYIQRFEKEIIESSQIFKPLSHLPM
jgi:hypothetical protein